MQRAAVEGVKSSAKVTLIDITSTPPLRRSAKTRQEPEAVSPVDSDVPDTPAPDYEEGATSPAASTNRRSSINFVKNFRNIITNIHDIEELYTCFLEPDPDYHEVEEENEESDYLNSDLPPPPPPLTAEELSVAVAEAYEAHIKNGVSPTSSGPADPPPIKPKPLLNPCLESKERQALHRELLMNYKIGKDVLKKPELNKVLRDRREKERKKEWDEKKPNKGRTSLEVKLEERAKKMQEEEDKMKPIKEDENAPELTRVHRMITLKSSNGSE